MLDIGTYGDSPAARDLVNIINERKLNHSKVGKLLANFNKITADLNHVDISTAIQLMQLLYHDCRNKCNHFEEPLNTYTQNVLSTKYKEWQVRKNVMIPKKK